MNGVLGDDEGMSFGEATEGDDSSETLVLLQLFISKLLTFYLINFP